MKKYLSFMLVAAALIAPSLTLADQNDDMAISRLQAQVAAIQVQIQALLAQRQGGSSGGGGSSVPSQTPPQPTTEGQNIFNRDLSFGKKGEDVRDLQEFLTEQGYYAGPITENYGLLTLQAVKKFQQANGITPASGYFGAKTRALASEIFRKLVGQICGEEGCDENVLPAKKLFMQADSMSVGTVGDYLQIIYKAYGGSGNYSIQIIDGDVPGLEKYVPCELASDCPPKDKIGLAGTPTKSGAFNITFLVKDLANESAYGRETFTIVIKDKVPVGRQPVIRGVKGPTTLKVGEEGIWSVEAQNPSRGALVYRVIWGDEVPQREVAASPTPQRAIPFRQTATFAHTYYNAGVYTPIFYVVNDRGSEVKTSITVNVAGPTVGTSIIITSAYENKSDLSIVVNGSNLSSIVKLQYIDTANNYTGELSGTKLKSISSNQAIFYEDLRIANMASLYQIKLIDSQGNISNAISFDNRQTTQPSITVTSPNGGEVWQLRNTHTILWTPYDPTAGINPALSEVNAYLEKLENGSFVSVGKIIPSGKASIHWDGDLDRYGNLPATGEYYIRVTNTRTGATDRSDRPFTLVAEGTIKADVKVNGSDGPVTLSPGSTYTVSWDSTNADSCDIYYPQDTTGVQTKYSAASPSGDKNFIFPGALEYGVYVTATCKSSRIEGFASDSVLLNSSQPLSSITVISPQGGEINFSSPYTINWRHTSGVTKVSIALYKNDAFYNWITTNLSVVTKEGGTFGWTPSNTISSANIGGNVFKIYVIGYKSAGGTVEDKSDSPFSITAAAQSSITFAPAKTSIGPSEALVVKWSNSSGAGSLDWIGLAPKGYQWQSGDSNRYPWKYTGGGTSGSVILTPSVALVPGNYQLHYYTNDTRTAIADGPIIAVVATTATQPSITVLSPNGGEMWQAGKSYVVSWRSVNVPTDSWVGEINLYKGNNFLIGLVPTLSQSPSAGSIQWAVPVNSVTGDDFKVEVVLYSGLPYKEPSRIAIDTSNAPFSIAAPTSVTPSITVTSPNGGESYKLGDTVLIRWTSSGVDRFDIILDSRLERLTPDRAIAYGVTGNQYSWTPIDIGTGGLDGHYRILVRKACSTTVYLCPSFSGIADSGDDWFSVASSTQSSITVTFPNGGERFVQGINNTLSWQGGKNMVRLGLVEGNATNQADPAPLIIGWINEIDTARYTQSSIAWDGKQVCDLNFVSCKPVTPGNYKLIASSQDANGNFVLWDNIANKPGNWDISNAPFSIVAATTIVPTMNVSLDVSTPTSVTLNPGQAGVRFASIKVSANKDPINNMNSIQIGSDSANAAAFLANFKVYDGATLLSSSSFDMDYNGNYYYKWMRVSGVSIPAYSDKVLTVMADVKPQSPVGAVRLGIAGWNFDSPGATVAPFGTPFYGNQMTVASVVTPSITVLSPRTGAILNLGAPVVNVSWTHSGLPSSSTIEIELQKGNTVVKNYGSYNNTGNATIVIPSEMAVGDDYKINVLYRFSQNQGVVGSSGMFSIVAATTPTFRLDPIGNKTAIVGQELSFAISASGADDGAVVFQTSGRPAGAKFLPLGDTTLNGGLSSLDGSYILQYLEGSPPRVFSAAQRILADVNRDETIAKADYNLLLNIVVGNQKRKNVNVFSWTPTVAGAYPITFIATAGGNTVREIATITVVAPSSGGGEGGGGSEGGGGGGGDGAMNTEGNQNLAALLSAMQASLDKIKEATEKLR